MNKKLLKYSFIIIILSLFLSCRNKSDVGKIVEKWYGKQFILPDDSLMMTTNGITVNPFSKKIKIVTAINGSCGACIGELKDWMSFMSDIDTCQVGLIFLIYSNDYLMAFEKINNSIIHFSYPYINDKGKKFFLKNNIPDDKLYQTFLLDSTNHVILIGNPIYRKELSAIYKSEIKKRATMPTHYIEAPGVKIVFRDNCAFLHFGENIIWQDEDGKKLTGKEVKELSNKNDYWLEQTSPKLVTIKKRSKFRVKKLF